MTWSPKHAGLPALVLSLVMLATSDESVASYEHSLTICKEFGCKSTQTISLQKNHWKQISTHFQKGIETPEQERDAIAKAVADFESIVGPLTNTDQEKGGNIEGYGLPGQMDCIDESINTTNYLQAMEQRGLLRWHTTGKRAFRRPFIFDQHWTATITQIDSGKRWAVDSWVLDNGKRPYVQAIDRWYRKATLPNNPDYRPRKYRRIVSVER